SGAACMAVTEEARTRWADGTAGACGGGAPGKAGSDRLAMEAGLPGRSVAAEAAPAGAETRTPPGDGGAAWGNTARGLLGARQVAVHPQPAHPGIEPAGAGGFLLVHAEAVATLLVVVELDRSEERRVGMSGALERRR